MTEETNTPNPRPFVSVHMRCCNVYVRIYQNAQANAYVGWCPKCAAQIRMPIVAEGGTSDRMFSAS